MLDPNQRSLTTSLLTPPPGMRLDQGLATTYSLDLLTLLTAPVHLALLDAGSEKELLADPLYLQEALRRVAERLTIYTDRGHILDPHQPNILLSLLEPMVVEVRAPHGGAFHAKIWVLRFATTEGEPRRLLRLAVLTRNLTADRSWDLALQLEGEPSGRYVAANRELGEFVRDLPTFAAGAVTPARRQVAEELAEDLRKTNWELPGKWEEVSFRVLGRSRRAWRPPESDRLAVVSPFLSNEALRSLRETTKDPVALISRVEALQSLTLEARSAFRACWSLDDAAESEDGEEPFQHDQLGLHAKAYVLDRGWYTHLIVGSANATDAALLHGINIEVLAELRGRRAQVGRIETVLDTDHLGRFLQLFSPQEPVAPSDPERAAAERTLELARRSIAKLDLQIHCVPEGGEWRLLLSASQVLQPCGLDAMMAWPLSITAELANPIDGLLHGAAVSLGIGSLEQITGLVGFEVRVADQRLRFVLNLPVEGMPEGREGAILRKIVQNRESFLRYLLLLLGEFSGSGGVQLAVTPGGQGTTGSGSAEINVPLLEDLVRALSREPQRLRDIQQVIERLDEAPDGTLVPPEFRKVWDVLVSTMDEVPA